MTPLLRAFVAGLRDGPRTSDAALEEELANALASARAAWPTVNVEEETFGRALATRIPADVPPHEGIAALRAGDVYLAIACASGDAAAIAEMERRYVPEIRSVLGSMGLAGVADETVQTMRDELLVGTPKSPPRITGYGGRGNLRRWLRAVAVRTGLRLAGSRPRAETPLRESDAVAAGADVEVDYLKRAYRGEFGSAFRDALASLSAKERLLLKQRFRHALSLEELAAMNGVHASTVSRWVADARERLVSATRDRMMSRLNVGRAEAESILRLVQSQVDVTLSSMPPAEEA